MATPQIPRRFQALLDQASAEAQVRYTPLLQAINQAAADAHGSYLSDVGQAHAAGDLLANTARSSLASVSSPSNPLTQLAQRYQGAPGVTSTIANNLGLTAGSLQSMLAQREAQAGPTQVFQIQNAQAKRDQTLADLSGKAQDLQGQIGQYITGRYDSLVGADRKQRHDANQAAAKIAAQQTMTNARLAVTSQGQQLAHQDRQTGQALSHQDRQAAIQQRRDAAAAKKNGQSPFLNANQQATQVAKVKGAQQGVSQLMAHPQAVPSEVATLLRAGKVDGVKYTQPQIDVAFDLYRNHGKLSQRGVRVLHKVLKVQAKGNFGIAPPPRAPSSAGNSIGALAQGVQNAAGASA